MVDCIRYLTTLLPRRTSVTLVLAWLCVATGCSEQQPATQSDRASIAGCVNYQSSPLPGGNINFVLESNPKYRITGRIKDDGTYSFDGAPIGKVRVAIETMSMRLAGPSTVAAVPRKYGNIETSGLTYDVQPGENLNVDFDLTD